jgi:hypothetical protein
MKFAIFVSQLVHCCLAQVNLDVTLAEQLLNIPHDDKQGRHCNNKEKYQGKFVTERQQNLEI